MGMFLNYQQIDDNYTPNNLSKKFPKKPGYSKLDPIKTSKPYEQYNIEGNLVGYYWRYGEVLNLEFNIDGEITVEDDSIIYKAFGEQPTTSTIGKIGQKAYNIVDLIAWVCTSIDGSNYSWTRLQEFIYPEVGKSIYLSADDYLKDKNIRVCLYDFRHEQIFEKVFRGSSKIIFNIDSELSKKLVRGIYYCSLNVYNDSTNIVVFDENDCKLLVK